MSAPLPARAGRGLLRRLTRTAAVLTTLIVALTAAAVPAEAQHMNRDQFMPFEVGDPYWVTNDDRPLAYRYYGSTLDITVELQFDQRLMSFGQTLTNSFRPYTVVYNPVTKRSEQRNCGSLEFVVTRYQSYRLQWRMPNGQVTTFLSRPGLIADAGRPMVGVFFRYVPGNPSQDQVVIQTYAYASNGKVLNAWVAAASTPTKHEGWVVVGKNGVYEEFPGKTIFAAPTTAC